MFDKSVKLKYLVILLWSFVYNFYVYYSLTELML